MDELERSFDIDMDFDSNSYDEQDGLSDLEIDDILGKENTDDAGVGMEIDPTTDPNYDPNVELPADSDVMYVKNPKTGKWELKKKPKKAVDKNTRKNTYNSYEQDPYSQDTYTQNYQDQAANQPSYENQNVIHSIEPGQDDAIVTGADVVVHGSEDVRDNIVQNTGIFDEAEVARAEDERHKTVQSQEAPTQDIKHSEPAYAQPSYDGYENQNVIHPVEPGHDESIVTGADVVVHERDNVQDSIVQATGIFDEAEVARAEEDRINATQSQQVLPQEVPNPEPVHPQASYDIREDQNVIHPVEPEHNEAIVTGADVISHDGDNIQDSIVQTTGIFNETEVASAEADRAYDRARVVPDMGFTSDDLAVKTVLSEASRIDDAGNVFNENHDVIAVIDQSGNVYSVTEDGVSEAPVASYSGVTDWMSQAEVTYTQPVHENADAQIPKEPVFPNVNPNQQAASNPTPVSTNQTADTPTNKSIVDNLNALDKDVYETTEFSPMRDLDVYAIHGGDLPQGQYGALSDSAHPMSQRDAAESIAELMSASMGKIDIQDAAAVRSVAESLADTIVADYSNKVFTDEKVLNEAAKILNGGKYEAPATPEKEAQAAIIVNAMKDAYSQAQMKFVMNNESGIRETITTAKAEAEKKWAAVEDANIARGTQAILEFDAMAHASVEKKVARNEILSDADQKILSSARKTPESAKAEYMASDAYKKHADNKADYINEAVSVELAKKFGARAGYTDQVAKTMGVDIKPNTIDVQARAQKLGGWEAPVNMNDVKSASKNGTVDANSIHYSTEGRGVVSKFGDWVVNTTFMTAKSSVQRLVGATFSASDNPHNEDDVMAQSLYKHEFNNARQILGIAGSRAALAGQNSIQASVAASASNWLKTIEKISIDPKTGKVLLDGTGIKINGYEGVHVIMRGQGGTPFEKVINPEDIIAELQKNPLASNLLTDKELKSLAKYGERAGNLINVRNQALNLAIANEGLFTKAEMQYLTKDGGSAFFKMKDATMNDGIYRKILAKSGSNDPLIRELLNARGSKNIGEIRARIEKKYGKDSPQAKMAANLFNAAKAKERAILNKISPRALLGRVKVVGGGLMNMLDSESSAAIGQMRGWYNSANLVRKGGLVALRLGPLGVRAHILAQNKFFASRVGRAFANHTLVGRWLSKKADFEYKAMKWAGETAKKTARVAKHVGKTVATAPLKGTAWVAKKTVVPVAKKAAKPVVGVATRAGAAVAKQTLHVASAIGRTTIYKRGSSVAKTIGKGAKKVGRGTKKVTDGIGKVLGFVARPFTAIANAFNAAKAVLIKYAAIGLLLFVGVYFACQCLLAVLTSFVGTTQTYVFSVMDHSSDTLKDSVELLYDKESETVNAARETVDGDPAEVEASLAVANSTMDGEEKKIEHFGHPENSLEGSDTKQKASQGFNNENTTDPDELDYENVIYVRPAALDDVKAFAENSGNIDKTDFDKYNFNLRYSTSDSYERTHTTTEQCIAIAAAMFDNLNIRNNIDAYTKLLEDLYKMLEPDETITAASALYATQYSGEESWKYYCNDKEESGGRAYATYDDKEYSSYISDLTENGGALYNESGMIAGTLYTDDPVDGNYTNEDIDALEWHLDDSERGCEFDWDAYNEAMSDWYDDEPDYDDYSDYDAYENDHNDWEGEEPDRSDYYYCPGHDVTICYGHRDVAVYIPQYTLDDIADDPEFISKIQASENYSEYEKFIQTFIEKGGFQSEKFDYKQLAKNFIEMDWMETYGINLDEIYAEKFNTKKGSGGSHTSPGANEPGDGDYSIEAEGTRAEIAEAAKALKGRISYYYGGKARYADFDKNGFGKKTTPDSKGRTKWGLDCSGYVDFAFAQLGIGCNGKKEPGEQGAVINKDGTINQSYTVCRGWGTGGVGYLPEYKNAHKLKVGDIGMHKSYNAKSQGSSNHIGIFLGWSESGKQIWAACGSHGVSVYETSEFVVYYDTSQLFSN